MLLSATVSSTTLVLASMTLFFMAFNLLEVIMPALLQYGFTQRRSLRVHSLAAL
jgi:hypothetical protein